MVRALPLVVLLCLTACSKGSAANASTTAAAAAPAQGSTAEPAAVKAVPEQLPEVIAKVNGESITKAEFEKALAGMEQRAGGPVPSQERDRIYRGIVDQLVSYHLLIQESEDTESCGRRRGRRGTYRRDPSAVPQRRRVHEDARRTEDVSRAVEDRGAPGNGDRQADRRRGRRRRSRSSRRKCTAFYAQNPQHFQQGDRVRASHILISAAEGCRRADQGRRSTKAEQVLKDVKAGKDFATVAKETSQDPGSAVRAAISATSSKGQMVGPFNDVAFTLKPGASATSSRLSSASTSSRWSTSRLGASSRSTKRGSRSNSSSRNKSREKETEAFVNGLKAKSKVEIFI